MGKAHGPAPPPPVPLPTALLLAKRWQAARACRQQKRLPVDGPAQAVFLTLQAPWARGLPWLASGGGGVGVEVFSPVQTHLPDKRGFESLWTPSVAVPGEGFAQEPGLASQ